MSGPGVDFRQLGLLGLSLRLSGLGLTWAPETIHTMNIRFSEISGQGSDFKQLGRLGVDRMDISFDEHVIFIDLRLRG